MQIDLYSPLTWIYVILTALVPGFLATWLGVGGCFLRIPMLMYLFGAPIKVAYAVNQAVIVLGTLPGVVEHVRNKHVYGKGLLVAAISAMVGVSVGAYLVAQYIPTQPLKALFGLICVGVGIYVLDRTLKARRALVRRVTVAEIRKLEHGLKLAALMFVAGFATGVSGFGGGIYYVPILMGLGYPAHVAVGTSSAQMIPVAGLGSTVLTLYGYQSALLVAIVGIPTLVASWAGARMAARSPPWILRLVYAISIIGAGLYVALDTFLRAL